MAHFAAWGWGRAQEGGATRGYQASPSPSEVQGSGASALEAWSAQSQTDGERKTKDRIWGTKNLSFLIFAVGKIS